MTINVCLLHWSISVFSDPSVLPHDPISDRTHLNLFLFDPPSDGINQIIER